MASADFCRSIMAPLDAISTQWQIDRPPRVRRVTFPLIPAAYTTTASVQVLGFEDSGLLTHCGRLVCDSCSSGQCFACGFLQIPPRDGHPCRPANRSPCRANRGLAPPSHPTATTRIRTAPCLAHHKKTPMAEPTGVSRKAQCKPSHYSGITYMYLTANFGRTDPRSAIDTITLVGASPRSRVFVI